MRPIKERFEPGRNDASMTPPVKYIIISERYKTEPRYFEALSNHGNIAGIRNHAEIIVLQRESLDSGLSHPSRVLDLLDEYMKCVEHGSYTLDLVLDMVSSIICEVRGISKHDSAQSAYIEAVRSSSGGCVSPDGYVMDLEELLDVCYDESVSRFGLEPRLNIPDLMDYRPESDIICVVVDRDRDNRDRRAMYDFRSRCNRSGYRPYITNPCFELWLMMHFEEFDEIDKDTLLNNPIENGKRFTESELDRILNGRWPDMNYNKESYDPYVFIYRTVDAIDRGMSLCRDPNGLISNLGTNLCDLLREMRGDDLSESDRGEPCDVSIGIGDR